MATSFVTRPPREILAQSAGVLTGPYYSHGLRERFRIDALRATTEQIENNVYADIEYEPDEARYRARSEARVRGGGLESEVPSDWPKAMRGSLVWSSKDFDDESSFVYHLTDVDKTEIADALRAFKEQGLDGDEVSRSNFPLPTFSKHLDKMCEDVYDGLGFSVVRGLDPEIFSVEDLAVVYLGLSSYVGDKRGKQDQRGSMLMHVMKRGGSMGYQDSLEKPFHTDTVTDCLCLFARSISARGGASVLSSSWAVYNELAATRPDLIHVLAKPDWPFDTFGRDPPYYKRALLYYHHGKIIFSFSRRLLVGHNPHTPRTKGIPGLTEAQAEALDAVHFIAKKHEIRTSLEKGDIRFVNNMAILHRREDFQDEGIESRHLIRIWLNNELMCWKLPQPLRLAWARIFEDSERESHWDIEPPRKNGVLLRVAGSCD